MYAVWIIVKITYNQNLKCNPPESILKKDSVAGEDSTGKINLIFWSLFFFSFLYVKFQNFQLSYIFPQRIVCKCYITKILPLDFFLLWLAYRNMKITITYRCIWHQALFQNFTDLQIQIEEPTCNSVSNGICTVRCDDRDPTQCQNTPRDLYDPTLGFISFWDIHFWHPLERFYFSFHFFWSTFVITAFCVRSVNILL